MQKRDEGWHRADILAEVRKRGSSLAELARREGLKRQTMYWAMSVSPRMRPLRVIADFIGVSLHELWPHWFDDDDKLISTAPLPRPAADRITRGSHPARPTKKAA